MRRLPRPLLRAFSETLMVQPATLRMVWASEPWAGPPCDAMRSDGAPLAGSLRSLAMSNEPLPSHSESQAKGRVLPTVMSPLSSTSHAASWASMVLVMVASWGANCATSVGSASVRYSCR